MSEQKNASQTAETTLLLRALTCFEQEARIRGVDHMAELFLPEETRRKLQNPAYRMAVKAKLPEGLYAYIIARTAYFDEVFVESLQAGFPQIVLLGAGYDTRAYRLAPPAGKAGTIFEVDAPPTQEQKLRILQEKRITHDNIAFVSVDFEKNDLVRYLVENGYNASQKTLLYMGRSHIVFDSRGCRDNAPYPSEKFRARKFPCL